MANSPSNNALAATASGGLVTANFGGISQAQAVALQADGKIVVAYSGPTGKVSNTLKPCPDLPGCPIR